MGCCCRKKPPGFWATVFWILVVIVALKGCH